MSNTSPGRQVTEALLRAQRRYWQELVELKKASVYMRLLREDQARWATRIAIIKAVATSGSIAGWAIWKEFGWVWATIVGISTLTDTLREQFPHLKRKTAAGELLAVLDNAFQDAQLGWETILSGRAEATDILKNWSKLQTLRTNAEKKYFPDGVTKKPNIADSASNETKVFFQENYDIPSKP
jgi:hypothetical protein